MECEGNLLYGLRGMEPNYEENNKITKKESPVCLLARIPTMFTLHGFSR